MKLALEQSALADAIKHPRAPYSRFSLEEWAQYRDDSTLPLSEAELAKLCGFNQKLTIEQVQTIYLPLCRLINLYVKAQHNIHQQTAQFLGESSERAPYIIGISGSVAVGKSTTSRLLQAILSRWPNHPKVDLITTDGFLLPNKILAKQNLLHRKGFPESYDLKKMVRTLRAIKAGKKRIALPLYSHEIYDIVPNGNQMIGNPDIVIFEGLNLLNSNPLSSTTHQVKTFVADFLDFSIYVDAETPLIEQWYLERFMAFRAAASNNPDLYFYRFTQMSDAEALAYAKNVWHETNLANLEQNILPYKYRAKLILEKGVDHNVDGVLLRRG